MRVAVIGHVEHITLGRVPRVPRAGEIAHAEQVRTFPGGGGGIAFFQLAKSPGEAHLFTAVGADEAAEQVRSRVESTGARIHLAHRTEPHTRDLVLITPDGERTIVVLGEPLHPEKRDALPWDVLSSCDAAYFTAQDTHRFAAPRSAAPRGGSYGAGDSFAGALTWYLALGLSVDDACARAAHHGAAVLGSLEPIESQLPLPERIR